ncbi:MAG TPA: C39 family peptidase [Albitalea sp.]|uniref:C39 family peptidase n=1 Tax=Piscinibacter sp. TaxID=1903157 RepID=UPI002ED0D051
MWMILLGVAAAVIGGMGVTSQVPVKELPPDQFELPVARVGGGAAPESVRMEPLSEFKFRHIVRQAYDYSCGSAALVTVMNHYLGLEVSEQQAMEGMLAHGEREKIIARRGFSLLDMKRYLATQGADAAGFRAGMDDLQKLTQPAIVPIDYAGFKHFVVLRGIRDGRVFLADPSAGHIVFPVEDFAKLWDRNTLFLVYPAKSRPETLARLALSDRELGVIDGDLIRPEAVLPNIDRSEALQRAVQSGLGIFTLRK